MHPLGIHMWIIFLSSVAVAVVMTPLSIRLARRTGAMDVPTDERRMHDHPMPRIGGMAIFLGATVGILMSIWLGYCDDDPSPFVIEKSELYGIALCGALMYLLGLLDDYINLKPGIKLIGQIVIASVVFAFGVEVTIFSDIFNDNAMSGIVCYLITILWIVGITNTINLVDGLDGLAAGIVVIACFCIAYVAYIRGYYIVCFPLLAVAGGCIGFLPFNFFPAKTFMGDGGSLFLGFMLATFPLLEPAKSATVVAVIIPTLVLSLPILDTFFAIIRRIVNHKPIMGADKGHLHHRLMRAGLGQVRTVLCMYGVCGLMSMAAIMASRDLYKETAGIIIIAIVYLYVILTDPNRRNPRR